MNVEFFIDEISDFIKEKFVNDMVIEFQTYHNTKIENNYEFDSLDLAIDIWIDAQNVDDEYVEITNIFFGAVDYVYQLTDMDFYNNISKIEREVNNNLIGYRQDI